MRRNLFAVLVLIAALMVAAGADAQRPGRTPFAPDRVTILTDGLADPASPAVQMIAEAAGKLAPTGLRVLPIAGEGGAGNVRDLLMLRGVDLAILDSDVFAQLELSGEFPDAPRRIRYVSHLYDQTVYVLARKSITSLEALRGRSIAAAAGIGTARTLLGLNKLTADIKRLDTAALSRADGLAGIDGLVLLGGELARFGEFTTVLADFHLLPVAPSATVRKAYRPISIAPAELAGIARAGAGAGGAIDGVALSTVLAVFDWTPQQSRYGNVTTFIKGLFAALPELREASPGTPWRRADVKATIPGWTRHAAAEPARLLTPAQLAQVATVERALAPPSPSTSKPATAMQLSLTIASRAPLADEHASGGGLIPALLRQGLTANGQPALPTMRWSKLDAASLLAATAEAGGDILLPWDLADCERPNDLTQAQAILCDRATFSDPIMPVVVGLFTLAGSDFKFETDTAAHGRTLCVPLDRDIADLTVPGRNWIAAKRVTLLRPATLIDCASLVQRREADAFVANDVEGWHLLKQLGIAPLFALTERPLGTRTLHAAVWKGHPRATELLETVNTAIRLAKDSGAHATLVRQHLMSVWDQKANVR